MGDWPSFVTYKEGDDVNDKYSSKSCDDRVVVVAVVKLKLKTHLEWEAAIDLMSATKDDISSLPFPGAVSLTNFPVLCVSMLWLVEDTVELLKRMLNCYVVIVRQWRFCLKSQIKDLSLGSLFYHTDWSAVAPESTPV